MKKRYSFIQESIKDSIIGGLIGAGSGAFIGSGIGKLVDYIRSADARAEADKKRAEYMVKHKNDYSDKEIIDYLNHIIDRNTRRVTELIQQLNSARSELQQIIIALSNLKSNNTITVKHSKDGDSTEETRSTDTYDIDELRRRKSKLEYLIHNLHNAISSCNDTISRCKYYLDRKYYSATRSELVNRDADEERERIYDSLRKKNGVKIGAGLGALLGGGVGAFAGYRM